MEINYRDIVIDSKFYNESCALVFTFKKYLAGRYSIGINDISWGYIQRYINELIREKKLILQYTNVSAKFDGYSECKNNAYIMLINKNEGIMDSRLRFTFTHELAHVLLHLPPIMDLGFELPNRNKLSFKRTELQADFVASDLLMNSDTIRTKILAGDTFRNLQSHFGVSQSAMQTRLHNFFVFELGLDFKEAKYLVNRYRYEDSCELMFKIPTTFAI